jgi:hypothetical protein
LYITVIRDLRDSFGNIYEIILRIDDGANFNNKSPEGIRSQIMAKFEATFCGSFVIRITNDY